MKPGVTASYSKPKYTGVFKLCNYNITQTDSQPKRMPNRYTCLLNDLDSLL